MVLPSCCAAADVAAGWRSPLDVGQRQSVVNSSFAASRHAVFGRSAESEGEGQGNCAPARPRASITSSSTPTSSVRAWRACCQHGSAVYAISCVHDPLFVLLGIRGVPLTGAVVLQEPHDLFRDKVYDYKAVRTPLPFVCNRTMLFNRRLFVNIDLAAPESLMHSRGPVQWNKHKSWRRHIPNRLVCIQVFGWCVILTLTRPWPWRRT